MDTRRKDCATGHLERKKTGYWYMVFRTKDEFRTINTWTKDRAEAQAQLDAILAKKNAEMAEARAAIPLAKVWSQYERSPNAYRHDEQAKHKKLCFPARRWTSRGFRRSCGASPNRSR